MGILGKLFAIGAMGIVTDAVHISKIEEQVISEEEYVVLKKYQAQLNDVLQELRAVAPHGMVYREIENHHLGIGLELAAFELVQQRSKGVNPLNKE